jgi:hypothetical protein
MRPEASPVLKSSRKRVVSRSRPLHEELIYLDAQQRNWEFMTSFLHCSVFSDRVTNGDFTIPTRNVPTSLSSLPTLPSQQHTNLRNQTISD